MDPSNENQTADEGHDASNASDQNAGDELVTWARRGGVVLALIVLGISLLVAFQAVTDAIQTWFEPRWVPIWRAAFAVAVAALAVWVLQRLTR